MLHCKIAHFKQNWESHPSYLDSRTLHMYHVKHQTWVYVICCNTLFVLAHIDISIIQKSKYFAKLICMYLDFVDQRNAYWIMLVSWSLYPLLQWSWRGGGGGILASPDTYIKCAIQMSVRPSVCGQNRVRSVSSTILVGSISYLHILSSNFRRCAACNACFKIYNFEILANSINL